jgi:hypothetical protein
VGKTYLIMQKTIIEKCETYSMGDLKLPCIICKKCCGSGFELNYPLGCYSFPIGTLIHRFHKRILKIWPELAMHMCTKGPLERPSFILEGTVSQDF